MALLVGGDARVAVHEPRHELALAQQIEQEVRGDDPERPLESHVVDRHEIDLRRAIARLAQELLVRLHQGPVEDLPEGLAEHLACSRHVRCDGCGVGDDLVLEARVELHVPDLVHQLGREE